MAFVINEVIDVPMSRVVAVTEATFRIKLKKFFRWHEREFYYLWFSQVGGPLPSKSQLVIGQHTEMGTLLRFYCDADTKEGQERQLEMLIGVICRRIAEAVEVKKRVAQNLAEGKITDMQLRLFRKFGQEVGFTDEERRLLQRLEEGKPKPASCVPLAPKLPFPQGTQVEHTTFGHGSVVSSNEGQIVISFDKFGVKHFVPCIVLPNLKKSDRDAETMPRTQQVILNLGVCRR